jgi:hypothetical protein
MLVKLIQTLLIIGFKYDKGERLDNINDIEFRVLKYNK